MAKAKPKQRRTFKHLISTPVKPAKCSRCREKVLWGLDGGVPVALDPEPITAEWEMACVVFNWSTWDIVGDGTARQRDMTHYGLPRKYPVHRGHYCATFGPEFPQVRL